MFFGEEGERLAQQRAAAQRAYAEELKRQIEEKQHPSRSPPNPIDSPPSGGNRPPSLLQQYNNQPPIAHPPPQGRQNPNPNPPNRGNLSPHLSLDPLPDLPPAAPAGPSPDAIRFADRLNWLESSVDQHQSVLKSASDSANRIERTAIPSLTDGIDQLRTAVERISQVDLPGRLLPLEEENARLEERISSAASEYSNIAQSLHDRLGETTSVFQQTQQKFNEFSDSVKSTILEFKSELVSSRDAHDSIAQRITQAESKASQTEESLRSCGSTLQNFEKTANDSITSVQQQINSTVSTSSLQIAQALKAESEGRDQATGTLHSQIEEVNQRAAASVTQVQNVINDLAISFRQSLNTLSSSVRDALEQTRTESDNQYKDLSERLDSILSDTESNFNNIQNESVSTLGSLNEHANKAREELERALTQECDYRKNNEMQIVQKYDGFKTLIINEMQLQTAQMEEMSANATQQVIKQCNDSVAPLKNEIRTIREKTQGAETLPRRVQEVEQLINQLNTQLVENVGALGQQSSNIVSSIDKMRNDAEQNIDHLNERIRILEDNAVQPEFATRSEVNESFLRLNSDFDGRMQEIEQQIGLIFSSLSDLTMSMPSQSTTQEPGAALLDQLANTSEE